MKKFIIILASVLLFQTTATAATIKGSSKSCKIGSVKTDSTYKYLCVNPGVWKKTLIAVSSTTIIKTTSTETATAIQAPTTVKAESPIAIQQLTPCGQDTEIPKEWEQFNNWYTSTLHNCSNPYRILNSVLTDIKPITQTVDFTVDINQCKIQKNKSHQGTNGFNSEQWWTSSRHPSYNTTFQVVPIYSEDAPLNGNTPLQDYGMYFDYIKNFLEYDSDVKSSVNIKVPSEYFKFDGKISSFNLTHERTNDVAQKFNNELIKQLDSKINFTGVNIVIVVVPAGTPNTILEQSGLDRVNTAEGMVIVDVMPPYTLDKNGSNFNNLKHPAWWLHELYHTGMGLVDTAEGPTQNLGEWGLMGRAQTDLIGWHKWLLGFYDDKQIKCQSKNNSTVTWIAPSSVKTNQVKLLMIPLSSTKSIAIESIRAKGFNFKLTKESEGALVYLIDESVTNRDDGVSLLLPNNRTLHDNYFKGSSAPLKIDDYIIYENLRISVIESGDFGDIIKIEKI